MVVLDRRPARDLAVAAAHGHDRELAVERDEALEDARHIAELGPRGMEVGGLAEHGLALAVVAPAARLQHRRKTDRVDGGDQVGERVDRPERSGRDSQGAQRLLLDDAVLRYVERARRREDGRQGLERARSTPARLPIRR